MVHNSMEMLDVEAGMQEDGWGQDTEFLNSTAFSQLPRIQFHRGLVLQELIDVMKSGDINPVMSNYAIQMVLPNGILEAGEDNGGVLRDCLSEFWDSFYEQCTIGYDCKVPFLRHDYGEIEWNAVGKIIVFGWKQAKYFPIKLCRCLFEYALFNTNESLIQDFFLYIDPMEREVLSTAMTDFPAADFEELVNIFDSHQGKILPNETNLSILIQQIAHKELLQTPAFVIECWQRQLLLGEVSMNLTKEDLLSLFLTEGNFLESAGLELGRTLLLRTHRLTAGAQPELPRLIIQRSSSEPSKVAQDSRENHSI